MIKECVICNTKFEPKRSDGIYCSGKCRRKPWNESHPSYTKEYASKNRHNMRKYKEKWNRSEKGIANRKAWYEEHKEEIIKNLNSKPTKNWDSMMRRRGRRMLLKYYPCKCFECGKTEGLIDAHHIDKDRSNNSIENLKWLCRRCHAIEHTKSHAPIS